MLKHEGGKFGHATVEYYRDGLKYFAEAIPYGSDPSGSDGPYWTLTTDADP